MDDQMMAQLRAQQKANDEAMAAQLRQMGMDPKDFMGGGSGSNYADPELAALEREMMAQERGDHGMDDEAAMLAALDRELGIEPVDPAVKAEELKAQMTEQTQLALRAKKAGDTETALVHVKNKKKLQSELEEHLLMHPEAQAARAPPKQIVTDVPKPVQRSNESEQLQQQIAGSTDVNDPIEQEEKYHDPNSMVSMAVIEHEANYLGLLMQKHRNSPDDYSFFEFRKETLQFSKETIETNIETGVTTPESYTADLKTFLKDTKNLMMDAAKSLGPTSEHTQRLKKRVQLIQGEIAEIEGGSSEQAPAQQQQQPSSQPQTQAKPIVNTAPEEEKVIELTDKQLKILGIIQSYKKEHIDAIQYVSTSLKNEAQVMVLLKAAENLKKLEAKLVAGNNLTREEAGTAKAVTGQSLFGYPEATRIEKMNVVYAELQTQLKESSAKAHKFNDAMKKMTRKADKDQATQAVRQLVGQCEELKKQENNLKLMAQNPFQPPPVLQEQEAMINQEKVNDELNPDQIQLTLTGSNELAACGASYIKYYLTYEEGRPPLMGHFQVNDTEKTFKLTMQSANLPKMLHNLKDRKIDFTIKKKKFFGKDNLETQSLPFTGFRSSSLIQKHVTIQGARLGVSLMIHKATRSKEFEKVQGTKMVIGPILAPFKTLEEIAAAKAAGPQAAQQPARANQAQPVAAQSQPAPSQQRPVQTQQAQQQPQPVESTAQTAAASSGSPAQLPDGVTPVDVKDPDNINNLCCVSYLEKKIAQFHEKMMAAQTAAKRDLMKAWQQKWIAANSKKTSIENGCASGQLTVEDYMSALQRQQVKDQSLLAYFKKSGDNTRAAIVTDRISTTRQELAEMV